MWNDSAQTNRNYIWENFTSGDQVLFMDPYEIYWTSGNRNLCSNPVNGVCNGPDPRWNNFRDNLGYTLTYANKMDLAKMTPQGGLSSTGYALAYAVAVDSEYLVYAPSGGFFTVDLSATTKTLTAEWFNPSTGVATSAGTVAGGSSSQSFTPPFGGDAVLYLVDAGAERSDTTPPSVPATVTAAAVSSSQITLSWTASTDPDSPVAGYAVYRNGSQLANVTSGTTYSDTLVASGTQYSYTVAAYDAAGNYSAQSSPAVATTP
jgi:hypothetical protein